MPDECEVYSVELDLCITAETKKSKTLGDGTGKHVNVAPLLVKKPAHQWGWIRILKVPPRNYTIGKIICVKNNCKLLIRKLQNLLRLLGIIAEKLIEHVSYNEIKFTKGKRRTTHSLAHNARPTVAWWLTYWMRGVLSSDGCFSECENERKDG